MSLSILQSLYKEVGTPDYLKSEILLKEDKELQKAFNSFLKVFAISEIKEI